MSKKILFISVSVVIGIALMTIVATTTEPSHHPSQYRSESWRGGPDYGQYMVEFQ